MLYWLRHLPPLLVDFRLDVLGHILMALKSGYCSTSFLAWLQLVTELSMLYVCNKTCRRGVNDWHICGNLFLKMYHGAVSAVKSTRCSCREPSLVPSTHISQLTAISNQLQGIWCPLLVSLGTCMHMCGVINSCRHMHIHTNKNLKNWMLYPQNNLTWRRKEFLGSWFRELATHLSWWGRHREGGGSLWLAWASHITLNQGAKTEGQHQG